ncbi:alpha-tubulin [Naegleria gruberi]|uniref:Alpha-tubulin n=1 Tax=Naegleria gruberi TaxID=5762 RepID=D2V7X5_NAEGR|nr:LOW QUALITY PROTEIN: alpha-tubulin [Naegleria gruberi]EFC47083.1 alpha-tubulin [Naegleria gruberi]|eukprot:XP_002679827.1 alpha-tubulin [Naegleria gruberi]
MKELIFLHFGNCGCEIGIDLWNLFAKEHKLPSCSLDPGQQNNSINNLSCLYDESIRMENVYHARCLFFDTDSQIQRLTKASSRSQSQFKEENIVSPIDYADYDASSNFGKGYHIMSGEMWDYVKERVRKMVENCDSMGTVLVTHSLGGGTGSGSTSSLIYDLAHEFQLPMVSKYGHDIVDTMIKSCFSIFPTETYSTSILEPYNAVIALHYIHDNVQSIFSYDNYALSNACVESGIKNPNFKEMNHLISQNISTLTSQIRFGSLRDVCETLPISYNANIICNSFVNLQDTSMTELSIKDIFSRNTSMNMANNGVTIAMNIAMRGDFSKNHTSLLSEKLKTDWKFSNETEKAQYQISNKGPENVYPESFNFSNVMHIANNTTSITSYLENLLKQFDLMYSKRAFVHWIVGDGGFEEDGFYEAREQLATTIECYSSFHN